MVLPGSCGRGRNSPAPPAPPPRTYDSLICVTKFPNWGCKNYHKYTSFTYCAIDGACEWLTCEKWLCVPSMRARWSTAKSPTNALGFVVTVMATSPPASTVVGLTLNVTCRGDGNTYNLGHVHYHFLVVKSSQNLQEKRKKAIHSPHSGRHRLQQSEVSLPPSPHPPSCGRWWGGHVGPWLVWRGTCSKWMWTIVIKNLYILGSTT